MGFEQLLEPSTYRWLFDIDPFTCICRDKSNCQCKPVKRVPMHTVNIVTRVPVLKRGMRRPVYRMTVRTMCLNGSSDLFLQLSMTPAQWYLFTQMRNVTQITNHTEHEQAISLVNATVDSIGDNEQHPLASQLSRLADLIEPYEQQHFPIE